MLTRPLSRLLCAIAIAGSSTAQEVVDSPRVDPVDLGTTRLDHLQARRFDHGLRIVGENDSIGLGDTTDKGYTNGVALYWDVSHDWTADFLFDLGDWLPFGPEALNGPAFNIGAGQQMFTPEDISVPDLIANDRPYAGFAFVDFQLQNLNYGSDPDDDRLDTWSLQLGMVGPSSRADDTQIEWHRIIKSPNPEGWGNQLRDEPAVQLSYQRQLRAGFDPEWWGPVQIDTLTRFGGQLGNVHTRFGVGGELRMGLNLPRDMGTGIMTAQQYEQSNAWHTFARVGVDGYFVARNIFLDGNTFTRSHDVERTWFVADFHVGLEVAFTRRLRLQYTHNFRTPEFDSPRSTARIQDFATVQFQWFF